MEPTVVKEQPAEAVVSAEQFISAMLDKKRKPYRFKKPDGTMIELTLQALSFESHQKYLHEIQVQSSNVVNQAAALAGAELMWILYGVINPETGEPLLKNLSAVKQLRDADAAAVQDLIYAIQVLSGHRGAINWNDTYSRIREATVTEVSSKVELMMTQFVTDDTKDAFDFQMSNMRLYIDQAVKEVMETVNTLVSKQYEYGEEEESITALTDEQLGND